MEREIFELGGGELLIKGYPKNFINNFKIHLDPGEPDGIDRTIKVNASFGFFNGYMHQEKRRYMHHKKKRIDKKWSKNPDYYTTRLMKKDYMPLLQTV